MINDDNDINPGVVEPNHRAFAIMAAKTGNVKFLEALLGPSIPKEKQRTLFLFTEIESIYAKMQLWEFQLRVTESQLNILSTFRKNIDHIDVLQTNLDNELKNQVNQATAAEVNRMDVHSEAYFHAEQRLYPDASLKNPVMDTTLRTMSHFFNRFDDEIKPDENGIYHIKLNKPLRKALKDLWEDRFSLYADTLRVIVPGPSVIPDMINYFHATIRDIHERLSILSNEKKIFALEMTRLKDQLYNNRCQRYLEIVADLQAHPDELVLAYSPNLDQLPALLKRARVPVDTADEQGNTLLHLATINGKFEVVRLLLEERDPDLSLRNKQDLTASETYNIDNDELKRIAKIYKVRHESKFLEDVVRDFEAYKTAHKRAASSLWKYLHTDRKIQERARQLEVIEREIELTKNLPTDEVLIHKILLQNLSASRGKLGRSKLFDPLIEHIRKFLNEKGYGVSSQDIRELLGKEPSAVVEMQLRESNREKDLVIAELNEKLLANESEKMKLHGEVEKFTKNDNELRATIEVLSKKLQESDNSNKLLQESFNEHMRQHDQQLAFLFSRMNINPRELPPVITQPTQSESTLANNPVALFGNTTTQESTGPVIPPSNNLHQHPSPQARLG